MRNAAGIAFSVSAMLLPVAVPAQTRIPLCPGLTYVGSVREPAGDYEPIVKVVEEALTSTIMAALDRQSLAVADLIRETPVLCARNQLKYSKLEQKLTEALLARTTDDDHERLRIRLLSVVVIGVLRVGGERWHEEPRPESIEVFARDIFSQLWRVLADFGNDIANAISFDRNTSSVNRSKFSTPDDARWVEETGEYKGKHGVISFPSEVYSGKTWDSNEKNKPIVKARIEQFHDPLQCNYAHTDFRFVENDIEVEKITRPSIKLQLRELLRPLIKREL